MSGQYDEDVIYDETNLSEDEEVTPTYPPFPASGVSEDGKMSLIVGCCNIYVIICFDLPIPLMVGFTKL